MTMHNLESLMNMDTLKASFEQWLEWDTTQEMIHATDSSTQELKQVLWAAFNAGVLETLLSNPTMISDSDSNSELDNV